MERNTILLIITIAVVGLFLGEINELTGLAGKKTTTTTATPTCFDSDDINFIEKGYVEHYDYIVWDVCIGNYIREYYCSRGKLEMKSSRCREGCYNGACKRKGVTPTQVTQCTDDDGGNNPNVKGTVVGIGVEQILTGTDYCLDSNTVKEHFCSGQSLSSQATTCENGCSKGVCL